MTTTRPNLLGAREASERLNISEATLRAWRCKGKGPKYVKFGAAKQAGVAYYADDIDAWLAVNTFDSTTAHSEAMRAAGQESGRYRTKPDLPITPPWLKAEPAQSVA